MCLGGKSVEIDMDEAGWVSVSDLIRVIADELPGVKPFPGRLVSLVYSDKFQSMQMWIEGKGQRSEAEITVDHFQDPCYERP